MKNKNKALDKAIVVLTITLLILCYIQFGVSDLTKDMRRQVAAAKAELQKSQQEKREKMSELPYSFPKGEAKKSVRRTQAPGIYSKHLRLIIDKTLVFLEVKNRFHWERLIYLTAIAESDGGRYLRQVKGPAKSPFQTEPETEKDILRWCKAKRPDLYQKIRMLRVPARLEIHEAEYNLSYAVALCYLEYLSRGVDPKNKTTKELAILHKIYYNTYLGKASVPRTLRKIEEFGVKI